ncbi:MAG: choice-of-anchor D domain-containing protein, partial [Bacteroidia bacterium]
MSTPGAGLSGTDAIFYVRNSRLYRYELPSGPEVSTDFSGEAPNSSNTDLVFDESSQKLYWVNTSNQVRSVPADFDGSTPFSTVVAVNNGNDNGHIPLGARGLSVDGVNGKIYIGEQSAPVSFTPFRNELVSYDVATSARTVLYTYNGNDNISSTVVDAPNNRVYWAVPSASIGYAALNGSSPQTLLSLPGSNLFTIRKDPTSSRIIFTDGNTNAPGKIGAISTSGGAVTDLYLTSPSSATFFVALRPLAILNSGDMYFTEQTMAFPSFAVSTVFLKGNVSSAPVSTSNVTGTSWVSPENLYYLAAGTLSPIVATAPEIIVKDADGTEIVSGDTSPSVAESTEFGNANINGGVVTRTYTIENTGTADLTLGPFPAVTISGSGAFGIVAQPATTTLTPAATTTFQVRFDPRNGDCANPQTATVSIANDDSDENPYTFQVQGTPIDNVPPTISCPNAPPPLQQVLVQLVVFQPNFSDVSFEIRNGSNVVVASGTATSAIPSIFQPGLTCGANYTFRLINNAGGAIANAQIQINNTPVINLIPGPAGITNHAFTVPACGSSSSLGGYANASCSFIQNGIAPTVSDNCGSPSLSYSFRGATTGSGSGDASGSSFSPGTTSVTYVVSDGTLVDSCSFNIVVSDTTSPAAICQNINVYLDGSGNASITASDVDGGSSDNCGSVSLSATPLSFSCLTLGAQSVTLTATDGSSNTSSCSATVTVIDSTAPVATCANPTTYLDASGRASITISQARGSVTDNCTVQTSGISKGSFDCNELGPNTITFRIFDTSGNKDSCSSVVTVLDSIAPTAICTAHDTMYVVGNRLSIAVNDVDNGSFDNCFIASRTLSDSSFSCLDLGVQTVTMTATDGSGNSSSCSKTVTVVDSTAPVAICSHPTIYLDASGNASISLADIDANSIDNCGVSSRSLSQTTFRCTDLGP